MKKLKKKNTHGARQWAEKTINCCRGCINECKYCYADVLAVRRGQVQPGQWKNFQVRGHDVARNYKNFGKRVMFPSTHDIFPENFEACHTVLGKLLTAGNDVLIVSKPRLDCIKRICNDFRDYKDKILFRFTIGAMDDQTLSFWEPGAPAFSERKDCLIFAHAAGFKTSVSAEPMLDSPNIDQLIIDLLPCTTDAIWLGTMNHLTELRKKQPLMVNAFDLIAARQTKELLKQIYDRWKNHPQIKLKNDIKKLLKLPLSTVPGLDM